MTDTEKKLRSAVKKLKKIYAEIPQSKKDIALDVIEKLAFYQVQMDKLQDEIFEHGIVTVYNNGKNDQDVVNPFMKAYNQIWPKYIQGINTLNKMLPAGSKMPVTSSEENDDEKLKKFLPK